MSKFYPSAQSAMAYGCSAKLAPEVLKGSWVDGKNSQTENESGRKEAEVRLTGIQVVQREGAGSNTGEQEILPGIFKKILAGIHQRDGGSYSADAEERAR